MSNDVFIFEFVVECVIVDVCVDVVCLYGELVWYGFVVWIGGNVLGCVFGVDFFVIKLFGVSYDELMLENMILCDLDGIVIFGMFGSDCFLLSDIVVYVYVYWYMFIVGGVVYMYLIYVVVWVVCGEEIFCVIIVMVDEFGGLILVGFFVIIGDDFIGWGIVEMFDGYCFCVVLMCNYGLFMIGVDVKDVVKVVVMVEDVVWMVYFVCEVGFFVFIL